MKSNRTPVIADVLFSLQCFLIVLAVTVLIAGRVHEDFNRLCLKMLPCAAAYVIAALTARLVRNVPLRLIIPVAAAAGCVALGNNPAEYIIFAAAGVIAVCCGVFINTRSRSGSAPYNFMFILSLLFVFMSITAERNHSSAVSFWINMISALYLPLCVAGWFASKLNDSTSLFRERADQPLKIINRRMRAVIISAVMIVLIVLLVLPQSNGYSLLSDMLQAVLKVVVWVVVFIAKLLPVFRVYPDEEEPEEDEILQLPDTSDGRDPDMIVIYIMAALMVTGLVVWIIVTIIRAIKRMIGDYIKAGDIVKNEDMLSMDTIERIKPERLNGVERRQRRSNAAKVRKIYKKRVMGILKGSRNELGNLAPDEIAAVCAQKGEDISELTQLYKKARYARACTDEDVRLARSL